MTTEEKVDLLNAFAQRLIDDLATKSQVDVVASAVAAVQTTLADVNQRLERVEKTVDSSNNTSDLDARQEAPVTGHGPGWERGVRIAAGFVGAVLYVALDLLAKKLGFGGVQALMDFM